MPKTSNIKPLICHLGVSATDKKKNKKRVFHRKPQLTALKNEIKLLSQECLALEEDLEDALAEYQAIENPEVYESLVNDLPINCLMDFAYQKEKRPTNLEILRSRQELRKKSYQYSDSLEKISQSLFEKEIDLALMKAKIMLQFLEE